MAPQQECAEDHAAPQFLSACQTSRVKSVYFSPLLASAANPDCASIIHFAPDSECVTLCGTLIAGCGMSLPIVPRELKRALDLIEGDPSRGWTVVELAAASGLAPRT